MDIAKYGFIYLWRDRKHRRFYIGSHWGTIDDGYICSSTWMRNAFARRPFDFKRRILVKVTANRLNTFLEEQKWLDKIKDEELGKKYYNLRRDSNITSRMNGKYHSEETKKKISLAMKGKPSYWRGKGFSEEYNKKMLISRLKFFWQITTPAGDILTIKNLNEFCREKKIDSSNLSSRGHAQGYICKKLDKNN